MQMRHTLVISALLAASLAGCNGANSLSSINDTFKTVKTASAALENANIAGAAIATNLAAVELISAFSSNANGVISAGGGNVISAGGGNYDVLQASEEKTAELNSERKDKNGKPVVTAKYTYTLDQSADGSLHYELKSFDGTASGFKISASGKFDFKSDGSKPLNGAIPATVAALLKGEITLNDEKLALDELSFNVKNPLPDNVENLGSVKMSSSKTKSGIDLKAFVTNKVIGIKGLITVEGKPHSEITADENTSPVITPIAEKK